ncbi:Mannosyltransferase [Fasciola gigantica]|uniref:Mannosyltransferase n=1 Tax=Fasciola gigantica TaxID=46835 RepID=A0A504YQE0_FASGI|nr:Mannosyltransferase [Fasciola gigantica]
MTAVSSVTTSVLIDSVFWQHLIWPEGIVFYYNAILNKSGQWGKSPFHWYFTSALPRALLATTAMLLCWFPFALRSLVLSWRGRPQIHFQPMSTGLVFVGLIFVSLYSVLPHKELRFIIYTVPVFNLAASVLWNFLEHSESRLRAVIRQKGNKNGRALSKKHSALRFCNWLCYAHLLMNLVGTAILLVAARKNYPGGHAMMRLNEVSSLIREPQIHICNLAAQTGVTRFLEEHENWTYNKTEGIENDVHLLDHSLFTHLISEIPTSVLQQQSDKFRPLFFVDGFDGITLQLNWTTVWQFIQFRTSPRLIVYERIK